MDIEKQEPVNAEGLQNTQTENSVTDNSNVENDLTKTNSADNASNANNQNDNGAERKNGESDIDYLSRLEQELSGDDENNPDEKQDKEKTQEAQTQEIEQENEVAENVQSTPIPKDIRQKLKIPEKFKDMESLVKSYSEVERFATQARMELSKKSQEMQQLQELAGRLQKEVEKGNISPEDRDEAIAQFKVDFELDPIATLKRVFGKDAPKEKENQGEQFGSVPPPIIQEKLKQAESDFEDLTRNMSAQEKIKYSDELMQIAKDEPNITSLKTLNEIREFRQYKLKQKLEQEKAIKDKQKQSVNFVNGSHLNDNDYGVDVKKIRNAQTIEELEKMSASLLEA
jgi:hypothetical protein